MAGKIVVAVDFGTTYSAIGYAFVADGSDPGDIVLDVIDKGWPGQGRRRSPKIPTVFTLERNTFKYGFQVQHDPDRVCFAKLFLDPTQIEQAQHLAKFTAVSTSLSIAKLSDCVTRYLRCLRERAFEHMVKEKGWTQDFIKGTPHDYVLSVPAIWSDKAKDRTLKCALSAGFGDESDPSSIKLVLEPEAAAVYTITTLPNCALKVNDVFVVCDAGGGTVDLATYRITTFQPSLRVNEEVVGKGELCGSVMLNRRFMEFVEKKIGPFAQEFQDDIEREFNDVIKPAFNGDDTVYRLEVDPELPDNPAEGIANGSLTVTSEDLVKIFEPVVESVLILLAEQVEAVKGAAPGRKMPVLLVGGFGSSEYLKMRISQQFKNCTVLQPPDAWSAVVRGAILRSMIQNRKIRCAYGVMAREKWSPEKHEQGPLAPYAADYKVWDAFEQKWTCKNRMTWYVKKGDQFNETKTVSFKFYRNVGLHHNLKFEIDLWAYPEGREGEDGPPFKDLDCRRIAIMKPDLSVIPKASLEKRQSPEGPYYKVLYQLEMSFDTTISFRLRYQDQLYGMVETEYLEPENDGGIRRE
ncbi:actin-like ATPase domain-containing protein [Trematosphaeria pertusa]|uniref:Actin-like ATPase domain-containing protein n=1 Tax=Trematosphaeria pertusa TaxID=390896 RepID=A0A6A6IV21_9PLEO|nr:actin-like ATPase domain-containing protein [Trematosphaeria pertusa]KAF2254078.1 actin-like ATPase domain-containing protein [Trematosphaeria pertusa]